MIYNQFFEFFSIIDDIVTKIGIILIASDS